MKHRVVCPSLSVALLGLSSAGVAAQRTPPRDTADARVHGVVLDRESHHAVAGAEIRLTLPEDDSTAAPGAHVRTTRDDGSFDFELVEPGTYRLSISRIGYRSLIRDIDVASGAEIEISAEIASNAIALDPVLATASRPFPGYGPGSASAREPPFGTRIDRQQIEDRRVPRLSDLLRSVPGLRFDRDPDSGELRLTLRSGCTPALFLDGLETLSIQHLDATIMPADLQAIDIFRGAETPVAFRSNSCGAILLHTRGRQLREGAGPFWKRLLLGVAFFTGIFFLLQ